MACAHVGAAPPELEQPTEVRSNAVRVPAHAVETTCLMFMASSLFLLGLMRSRSRLTSESGRGPERRSASGKGSLRRNLLVELDVVRGYDPPRPADSKDGLGSAFAGKDVTF